MTAVTFYPSDAKYATHEDSSYSAIESGSASIKSGGNGTGVVNHDLGSYYAPPYILQLIYFEFDTSSLPDTATVTAASLSMYIAYGTSGLAASLLIDVYAYDWGASFSSSTDWITKSAISSLTKLGTLTIPVSSSGYIASVEAGSAFRAAVNLTGALRVVLIPRRYVDGNAPIDTPSYHCGAAGVGTTGTSQDPKLTVTYTTETTVTSDVTSTAALNSVLTQDVTSTASIVLTGTQDVSSDAAISGPVTTDVASDAAIEMVVASDVTSGASVAISVAGDVSSTGAVGTTGTGDVSSEGSVSVTGTFGDVFSGGAISQTARETIISDGAVGLTEVSEVSSTAAVGAGEYTPNHDGAILMRSGIGRIPLSLGQSATRFNRPRGGTGR